MNSVQRKLIEEIEEHDANKLTEWERGFIDSVSSKDYTLTDNQNQILNKIHAKVVFGSYK